MITLLTNLIAVAGVVITVLVFVSLTNKPASAAPKHPKKLTGQASFYAKRYIGATMANGKPYNPHAFTLACDDLPLGTLVYIEYVNPVTGLKRSAHAEVTDRGPAQHLRNAGRIFDLSYALFAHLENPHRGVIKITATVMD